MSATADPGPARRARLQVRVEGTVQGVGFRPHVYRLALDAGLDGHVLNDARGVEIDVEGDPAAIERFLEQVQAQAPPLARIEKLSRRALEPAGRRGFAIAASPGAGTPSAAVTADSATCDACLAELRDPADRRFRYPFVNCTDCGPRFTIVRAIPYDRPNTTMAGFEMCPACRSEYEDPLDRRFHAQPNACPECGPHARLVDAGGRPVETGSGGDALQAATRALDGGAVLAVKGLGGYHLACRADDEAAVAALRARKHREDRPFALMAASLPAARELVELNAGRRGAAGVGRAPDRAGAAPAGRPGGRRGRPRPARAGRDAALLPSAPPAGRRRRRPAGDDQRQRVRRADRVRRRRRTRAPGRRSPTPSWSTTVRSTPAPTTRSCAPCGGAASAGR